MGWISYEIPDLEVKGKINVDTIISEAFTSLCDALIKEVTESEDDDTKLWEELTRILKDDYELISEEVSAKQVSEAIYNKDSKIINFLMLYQVRDEFSPIDYALDEISIPNFLPLDEAESTIDNYENRYTDLEGDFFILSESGEACVAIQSDENGLLLPNIVEAYGGEYGSDYIPDAPDIFEHGDSPHRELMGILKDDATTEYMAYRFIYREPEGSEDDREYAEYRDVFGPMRLGEVKLKLGKDTFITVSRRWGSNNVEISISRKENEADKTNMLDELATKYTKGLIDDNLSEWVKFFKKFHSKLGFELTKTEITYLNKLTK